MNRKPGRRKKQKRCSSSRSRQSGSESTFLLDQFSDADLRRWKQVSDELVEYEYKLYACLETQRALAYEELCNSLRETPYLSLHLSSWWRVVDFQYSIHPLSSKGSLSWVGGRFNIGIRINPLRFPPFGALYIAEDVETAWCEKFGLAPKKKRDGLSSADLGLKNAKSLTMVRLEGQVHNVFDLTQLKCLTSFSRAISRFKVSDEVELLAKRLRLSTGGVIKDPRSLRSSFLDENWRARPARFDIPANPQIFGKLLLDAGFEGVLYPSVRGKKRCLAIFPQNLAHSDSYIQIADESPDAVELRRLDRDSWRDVM